MKRYIAYTQTTDNMLGVRTVSIPTDMFTVPGAIVIDNNIQRLLINTIFYGKFTLNESRSIVVHESGTQACHYGTGWLSVYALKHF